MPASRELGAWTGTGSTTLGFVSESGSFRITWKAQNQDNARPGAFHLTLRSGISGRPLKVIADHKGAAAAASSSATTRGCTSFSSNRAVLPGLFQVQADLRFRP